MKIYKQKFSKIRQNITLFIAGLSVSKTYIAETAINRRTLIQTATAKKEKKTWPKPLR